MTNPWLISLLIFLLVLLAQVTMLISYELGDSKDRDLVEEQKGWEKIDYEIETYWDGEE